MLVIGQGFINITSRVLSITTGSGRTTRTTKQSGQSSKNRSRSNIFNRFSRQYQNFDYLDGHGGVQLLESQGHVVDAESGRQSSVKAEDRIYRPIDIDVDSARRDILWWERWEQELFDILAQV